MDLRVGADEKVRHDPPRGSSAFQVPRKLLSRQHRGCLAAGHELDAFTAADVRALNPDWATRSVICRGRDTSGNWADIPRPAGEHTPHRAVSDRA